jgi:hypothetical protein
VDHVTLNFNNNISTAAVYLDVGKVFDITWYFGLLHKLSEFSVSLIKLIVFITDKILEVLVEGGFSTPISGKGSSRSPSLPQ